MGLILWKHDFQDHVPFVQCSGAMLWKILVHISQPPSPLDSHSVPLFYAFVLPSVTEGGIVSASFRIPKNAMIEGGSDWPS